MSNYSESGVDVPSEEKAMICFKHHIMESFKNVDSHKAGYVHEDLGYFANIIQIAGNLCLAVSADGVGTKLLIAQMIDKYDTVGIDCIAMNVNDIICVGARPISFLDYIALEFPKIKLLNELGKGLKKGAELAGITIPGGETAQVKDMLKGLKELSGFDIAGTSIGIVDKEDVIDGSKVAEGDYILGIPSSGLHSNGYSLVRKIFFKDHRYSIDRYFPELGKSLGEELITPTTIYVKAIMEIIDAGVEIHALANITGDGLLNILRVKNKKVNFLIKDLPEVPIFSLIQKLGKLDDETMFTVFNMGIGFCIVLPKYKNIREACRILDKYNLEHELLGYVEKGDNKLLIPSKNLQGQERYFIKC